MSWQTINKVLGLAMIDKVFAERLLREPREALNLYSIQVSPYELEILCKRQFQTLEELCEQLVKDLGPDSPPKIG